MTTQATLPATKSEPAYEYEQHPLGAGFPAMEEHQFTGLVHSIAKLGILEPIVLHEGKILDGWHRYQAAKEAGHKFSPADFTTFNGHDAKAYSDSKNDHRRHLTNKDKQERVRLLLKDNPGSSDRQIAKLAGVHHNTVALVRSNMRPKEDIELDQFKAKWTALKQPQRRAFVEAFREDIREHLFLR